MIWGIVIIPVVMKPDWFKRFVKVIDIYFFIPAGSIPEWPANMHEALTIGLYISPPQTPTLGLVSIPVHGLIGKHDISATLH